MEKQTDRAFVGYGLAETQYEIKVSSKLADKKAPLAIIDIAQKIIDAHNDGCALNLKIFWTIN